MVNVICLASNISKGDYGCTVAEVRCISTVVANHGAAQHRSDKQFSATAVCISCNCAVMVWSSGPLAKSRVISAVHVGHCRSVEEIGPSTTQKLAATSDATSTHRCQMPPQQVMTHHPVSQWMPCQHRMGHRPVNQGQGCWESCLGRSQMQGLNGSWITS